MIIQSDSVHIPLRSGSVQTAVFSPPYYGLREYATASWVGGDPGCDHKSGRLPGGVASSGLQGGKSTTNHQQEAAFKGVCGKCGAVRVDHQIGLEPTPAEYVQSLVAVMREVWRVLRDDGTVWLNIGDSYAGGGNYRGQNSNDTLSDKQRSNRGARGLSPLLGAKVTPGLKSKDLIGIPWRVAFALQDDGWYLRSEIIWAKPNPMPESVTDRPTRAHEQVFLLSKSPRYYFDAVAIQEPSVANEGGPFSAKYSAAQIHHGGVSKYRSAANRFKRASSADLPVLVPGQAVNSHRPPTGDEGEDSWDVEARNKRDVWFIPTQPYKGAHFATFPEALVEPCILAGTSAAGACPACGAPWHRVVEKQTNYQARKAAGKDNSDWQTNGQRGTATSRAHPLGDFHDLGTVSLETVGWAPTCKCPPASPVPCVVLDPFSGTGTVGVVAKRHRRAYVGLELSWAYIKLQRRRLANVQTRMLDL